MPKKRSCIQFGEEIRRRRKSLNLTLEQLAERADLNPGYIGSMENGLRDPSLSTIAKLAHGFGIPMGALFDPVPVFSPNAFDFAKLFEKASPAIQAGILMMLRSAAKHGPREPASPKR